MSLKDIQKQVDEWINLHKITYWKPHEILARLIEETGELAREINNIHGSRIKKPTEKDVKIDDEIGDIIFTLCCLANSQNICLEEAFSRVMDRCYGRDKDRYEKK